MKSPLAQPDESRPQAAAAAGDASDPSAGPYVINLCSSTTPMALSQPKSPELERFSFIVSRRLEDGRERFRLHMGFFDTLTEAEEWLTVVREVYPGAWAGEAPGKRLRARAAEQAAAAAAASAATAAAVAAAAPAAVPTARPMPAGSRAAAPERRAEPAVPANVPTLQPLSARDVTPPSAPQIRTAPARPRGAPLATARTGAAVRTPATGRPPAVGRAPIVASAPVAPATRSGPPMPAARATAATRAAPPARATPAASTAPVSPATRAIPTVPAAAAAPRPNIAPAATAEPPRGAVPAASPAGQRPKASPFGQSNVREVLAALGEDTGLTREMPGAGPPPTISKAPAPGAPSLSDSQVLRILEDRRPGGSEAEEAISLLRPDDTGTRRALREAVASNSPVSFAVQLNWSVQPIDVTKVPPLAIFSAYTLYTVEGSREGRRWYGLRLGFFTDANSAKQVAYYVRSEFTSVAVVPVSPQERNRASDADRKVAEARATGQARLHHRLPSESDEFKLIDDTVEPPAVPVRPAAAPAKPAAGVAPPAAASAKPAAPGRPAAAPSAAVAAAPAALSAAPAPAATVAAAAPAANAPVAPAPAAGSPAAARPAGSRRVKAREKRPPQTLEETLEILGADQLEIDSGHELVTDGGRAQPARDAKNSPFTRLLDRLSERARRTR